MLVGWEEVSGHLVAILAQKAQASASSSSICCFVLELDRFCPLPILFETGQVLVFVGPDVTNSHHGNW